MSLIWSVCVVQEQLTSLLHLLKKFFFLVLDLDKRVFKGIQIPDVKSDGGVVISPVI